MKNKFVHLHVHTEYSLLDGLSKIKPLLTHVKANGMEALAITDHGSMYGAIEFYKKAKEFEIKPIIGMETYICNDHNIKEKSSSKNYHLLLLAKDELGYKNLMKLSSIAHVEGYYYRPRIDHEVLKKYSEGLICTSSCGSGEIPTAMYEESFEKGKEITQKYLDIFGDDFYIELQKRDYSESIASAENDQIKKELLDMKDFKDKVDPLLIKLSREFGIPLVATNDSHYIKKEDALAQDATVCIATGRNVSDVNRLRFIDMPDYYIKTPSEMVDSYLDYPDAIENTVKIAELCDLEITTLGKWFFPKFSVPDDLSPEEYITNLVEERTSERFEKVNKEILERIKYELEIINKKGYAPYFLIMMDMVNWANEQGIITNTRGSAAGSIISYILGITTVNPLMYYLPFERFLNPFRPSPPDIDLDISDNRREEMIRYICEKYGTEKVAQICTFGRMLSRAAVRDVARVLGYPYAVGDRISKMIPPPKQGFPITIPKALEEVEELRELYKTDTDTKKILDLAQQVEGNARHISVHAAGIVVSPTDLKDFTPIQREPSGDKIITQYEMHACEDVGLIKFDILGIRNLSILGEAVRKVKEIENIDVDLRNIPLDDKKTYEMLGRGETMGTFQLSSSGMTKYIKDLKPTRVEDLMAMVALYRPGPIAVIPEYIKRKKDKKLIKYLDPRMKKFLEASYGLIVYQDDLLFCALDLAGYTWEEADKFRKAVGKKIPEEMAAQKEKFIKGVIDNGQTKEFAEDLWKLFEPFQAYGFNKAHAASYGMVAYQTSYMKANYPVEFMCALLTAESNDTEKITQAVEECRRVKIKVLQPDINESNEDFTIVEEKGSLHDKAIRFGLSAVKNVGIAAIEAILSARSDGNFLNFADFLSRVDSRKVNKKVLESLIKVGAFEKFGKRAQILASMDEIRDKVAKKNRSENQQGLFSVDEVNKGELSTSSFQLPDIQEFSDEELQLLERQLMGFSLSAKPISEIISALSVRASHRIVEVKEEELEGEVIIAGIVKDVRVIITKKSGQQMAFVRVDDGSGTIDLVVFPSTFNITKTIWIENNPILIKGKIDQRDEEKTLIVEEAQTSGNLTENSERLYIKIPKNVREENLKRLKGLLVANPGSQKVTLRFEGTNREIHLKITIDWNEGLAKEINEVLEGSDIS